VAILSLFVGAMIRPYIYQIQIMELGALLTDGKNEFREDFPTLVVREICQKKESSMQEHKFGFFIS